MKKLLFVLLLLLALGGSGQTVTYPNPVTVTVINRHGRVAATYTLSRGQVNKVSFLLDGLQPGWYLIRVHANEGYQTYRIQIK